ncbi:TrmH family RNA methyltransferase [Patescibacteria group bacterium]
MRDVKIKKYFKKLPYTYAFGFLPTIELLRTKPTRVYKVLFKNESHRYKETEQIRHLCRQNRIKHEFNNRLVDKIAPKDNTYAIGIFEKYEDQPDPARNHIVLVNPSDFGNLGTIIRSMVAFNFFDLILIKPAADIFNPKVISTTTGALFKIRVKHYNSFKEYTDEYEFHKHFLFKLNGESKLKKTKFKTPYSLVFGHETKGLDGSLDQYGETILIEQSQHIDSLNIAMSASIAMYEADQNTPKIKIK